MFPPGWLAEATAHVQQAGPLEQLSRLRAGGRTRASSNVRAMRSNSRSHCSCPAGLPFTICVRRIGAQAAMHRFPTGAAAAEQQPQPERALHKQEQLQPLRSSPAPLALTSPRCSTAARRGSCARSAASACRSLPGTSRNRCGDVGGELGSKDVTGGWGHAPQSKDRRLGACAASLNGVAHLLAVLRVAIRQVSVLCIRYDSECKQRRLFIGSHGCRRSVCLRRRCRRKAAGLRPIARRLL